MYGPISRRAALAGLASSVAACGGSHGGSTVAVLTAPSTAAPAPSPTPTPSPTATPLRAPPTVVTVGAGGDYATVAAAYSTLAPGGSVTLVSDLSELVRVKIGTSLNFNGHSIIVAGDPTASPSSFRIDPVLVQGSCHLHNGTIQTKDTNYALHSESGGDVQDFIQLLTDMQFYHAGNQDIVDHNPQLSTSEAAAVLAATPAIGIGLSSGGTIEFDNCLAQGSAGGMYIHNSRAQSRPCRLVLRNTRLVGSPGLVIQTIGSGTADVIELDRADLGDTVVYTGRPEFSIRGTVTRPFNFVGLNGAEDYRPDVTLVS